MPKITDFTAQQVVHILRSNNLDPAAQIDELLPLLNLPGKPAQIRTNLRNIFEDAQLDHLDLLRPPEDFQTWVQKPLRRIRERQDVAKPNTVNARTSTLANFYLALEKLEVIAYSPLYRLTRPVREHTQSPLPSRTMLEQLHKTAQKTDPLIHAALLLIHELAFTVTALLQLQWSDINLTEKKLIRQTESQLPTQTLKALRALAGTETIYQPNSKVFPKETELRQRLWKLCGVANLPFLSPSKLRQAGLRDHGKPQLSVAHAAQAGYLDPRAYQQAVALAQQLEVMKTEKEDQINL